MMRLLKKDVPESGNIYSSVVNRVLMRRRFVVGGGSGECGVDINGVWKS